MMPFPTCFAANDSGNIPQRNYEVFSERALSTQKIEYGTTGYMHLLS